MYLLASDYDGTLKKDRKSLYLNLEVINKFRKEGNKFAIVTGRSFSSIKGEIYKYNIDYDYLSCNNGLIVFDNKDNILTSSYLKDSSIEFIINKLKESKFIMNYKLYNQYDVTYTPKNLLEILIEFKNKYQTIKFKNYIESRLNDINCFSFENKLFIGVNKTKADAVIFLQNFEDIPVDKVFTIGDDLNDLEMLKKFNGYKILNSNYKMWFNDIPITSNVHSLIKKIKK